MNKLELHEVLDAIALLEVIAGNLLADEIFSMKNKIDILIRKGND